MADITFSFYESEEEADWYDFSAEEYFWATVVPRPYRLFTDRSGESLWYFNLNMFFASIQAYRKMGETHTALKAFKLAEASPAILRSSLRIGAPAAAAVYLGMEATDDVLTMQMERAASIQSGGASTPPSKPWWMPMPLFLSLYG